ncbi:MAG: GH32 C-terminal domain-containing protein [Verrucomicrobia bacterium]|nr:GH32 C-terminal domain-containing protein [Verrucomicrobiota bacterium]
MNHISSRKSSGGRRRPTGRVWHFAGRFFRARFTGIRHAVAPCLAVMVAAGIAFMLASGVMAADDDTRTFKADKRYLLFPCTNGRVGQNQVFINVDGKPFMSAFDALIASANPDHWRWLDLKLMQGSTLTVKIEGPNAAGIELVKMSDTILGKYEMFSQMATFPLELSLQTTPDGVRLYADFVSELAQLRNPGSTQKDLTVKAVTPLKVGDVSQPVEMVAAFEPGSATKVSFTGAELNLTWNAGSKEIEVNGEKARLTPKNGRVELHILLDLPSVEAVTNGGEAYLIKSRDYRKLGEKSPMEIRAEGGDVKFSRLEVYPLKSIH